jgi:hypothetical protein
MADLDTAQEALEDIRSPLIRSPAQNHRTAPGHAQFHQNERDRIIQEENEPDLLPPMTTIATETIIPHHVIIAESQKKQNDPKQIK